MHHTETENPEIRTLEDLHPLDPLNQQPNLERDHTLSSMASDPTLDGQGLPNLKFRIVLALVSFALLFVAGLYYGIINP